ncbi:MAG: GGDEF domain-containing protein, partial [Solirubrobacterales bacterium]|nr:GGDEF domain-containing protein [Solirubrobacterales bacterium]
MALAAGFGLLLAILAVTAANAVLGVGGHAAQKPVRDWLSSAVYILVAAIVGCRAVRIKEKRVAWAVFATGLSLYGLGNVLWSFWIEHLPNPPIPSICDGLWLSLYPLSYAGMVGFASARGRRRPPAGVWLDGLIAGTGLAAIGAAAVFRQVLASATGSPVAVATELAYPIGDLLLAALVVGLLALRGWQVNRAWTLLGGGFLLLTVADCMYAVQVASGSSAPSPMTNLMYVLAVALLAFAAWQRTPDQRETHFTRWSALLIPAFFMLTAVGLLLYDHVRRLEPLAFSLAISTLVAATVRMMLAFRDMRVLSEARRMEAATDYLTSLPNRRLFVRRVEEAIAACRLAGGTASVLMLDLDHFKELNDTLGHDAGDALLRLIGPRLGQALRATDTVARLGGDEFAVLLHPAPGEEGLALVADKILFGLSEPFEVLGLALRVTGSLGIASYPGDARDANDLMTRADIAMYHAKTARNRYAFYAHERDTGSKERLTLAAELAMAIEEGGIEL